MLHLDFQFADLLFHHENRFFYFHQFIINRVIAADILVLGQIAQRFTAGYDDIPLIGSHLAGDNFKKRGLAGAVDSDDSRFFTFLYMK